MERLFGHSPNCDELLSAGATSKVLMVLYQADILDEEVVRQWGTHVSKKYVDKDKSKKVRKSSDAFLKVSFGMSRMFRLRRFIKTCAHYLAHRPLTVSCAH